MLKRPLLISKLGKHSRVEEKHERACGDVLVFFFRFANVRWYFRLHKAQTNSLQLKKNDRIFSARSRDTLPPILENQMRLD